MTSASPCPQCGTMVLDSVDVCPACGDVHIMLRIGSGAAVARYSARSWSSSSTILEDSEKVFPELESEIVAEPIVGYRIWEIDNDHTFVLTPDDLRNFAHAWDEGRNPFKGLSAPYLGGVGVDSLWARPVMEASCRPPGGMRLGHPDAPHPHCDCGIWALKAEDHIKQVLLRYRNAVCAWGTVQLWGRIVETEFGYRAQYAKPLSISVFGISSEEAAELAEAYDCKVTVDDALPVSYDTAEGAEAVAQMRMAMGQAVLSSQSAAQAWHQSNPPLHPKPHWLSRFTAYFSLSAALLNLAIWFLDSNLLSLFTFGMCLVWPTLYWWHKLRRPVRFLVGVIPFLLTLLFWVFAMAASLAIDWLFYRDRHLDEGPCEKWLWKHDPAGALDKWIFR